MLYWHNTGIERLEQYRQWIKHSNQCEPCQAVGMQLDMGRKEDLPGMELQHHHPCCPRSCPTEPGHHMLKWMSRSQPAKLPKSIRFGSRGRLWQSKRCRVSQMIHLTDDTRAVTEVIPRTTIESSCKRESDFIKISASVHTWSATLQVYFQSSAVVREVMCASLSEET